MPVLRRLQAFTLAIHLTLLLALVTTLWLPSPDRDPWGILLVPAAIIALVFTLINHRVYGQSRFYPVVITFFVLCTISIYSSPFPNRGWVLMFRPLAGWWILALWIEILNMPKGKRWATITTAALVLLVLIMGFSALSWTGKASRFSGLTDILPRWQSFWWWRGGLNVNEYAGAVTWILPALAGIAIRQFDGRGLRFAAGLAALILGIIMFLSQSLSGIIGTVAGLALLFVPARYFRSGLIAAGAVLLIGNLAVLAWPVQSANLLAEVSGRPDVNSLEHRAVMWGRARSMFADFPLSGVGIAMYRQLREEYATPGYEQFLVPHPHNEALQFATDLGLPGLVIYAWLALVAAQCALNVIRHGTPAERAAAIGLIAGLFGHAVYALTDAIPIWDRFAFVLWWWLGLLGGLDVRVSARQSAPVPDTPPSA